MPRPARGGRCNLSYTREESLGPCHVGEPCPAPLRVAMRSPLPLIPCVPDRHSNQERSFLLAGGDPGTLSFSHPAGHPSFGVSVLFFIVFVSTLCLFIRDCGERARRAAIAAVILFPPPFLPVVDCPARPGAGFFFIPRRCSGSPFSKRDASGGRHGGSENFVQRMALGRGRPETGCIVECLFGCI